MNRLSGYFTFVVIAVAVLAVSASSADEKWKKSLGSSPHQIENRLKSVRSLLNISSSALENREEASTEAVAYLDEALELHGRAKSAFESGNYEESAQLLMQSEKALFKSMRLKKTDGRGMSDERKETYFANRLKSTRAFLATHSLVAEEKKITVLKKELESRVEADIAKAIALFENKDTDEAISVLGTALDTLKTSLRTMHDGDTKARLLDFETPADEYDFVKRFDDDYLNLADKFIRETEENRPDFSKLGRMKESRRLGQELRDQAEEQARAGQHIVAIKTMEKSIRELKKVLRLLGFPIH